MKVCVVGGGSTYTPELIDGLLRRRQTLPVDEIYLLDPARERLGIVAAFARRMCEAAGSNMVVRAGDDPREAIRDSRFVITQLRVGGQTARHRDELMGRDFGLIGQETTGVGGFAKALRTIPVMLDVARIVAEEAPGAVLINFTNPAGLITELLRRHTGLTVVGLCNVPWNMRMEVAEGLGASFDDVVVDYVGLNHLSWARGFTVAGEDRTGEVLDDLVQRLARRSASADDEPELDPAAIRLLGMVPNGYNTYYYETEQVLRWQETHPTRASAVMEIERRLLERYSDPTLTTKPPELMERGGAYYSESAAALMADIHADNGAVHIVNARNDGAVPGLPDDVVIEIPAAVGAGGARALPTTPLRADVDALVRTAKDYELLTIEAALGGDRDLALLALATNPLGPTLTRAGEVFDRIRADNPGRLGALDG